MIINFLTGILNFLSFQSLTITTSSENSFLAALFIFSASILLEALSLRGSDQSSNSKIIFISIIIQGTIGITGMLFAFGGLLQYLDVNFQRGDAVYIFLGTHPSSIYYIQPVKINSLIIGAGLASSVVPLCLTLREAILCRFRKAHYNLNHGLYGK